MLIQLTNLAFFAHHGLYESETVSGNDFMVDCTVEMDEPATTIRYLSETIDYVVVYDQIKARMHHPTKLLETVAQLMVDDILETHPLANRVSISIKKMKPPIQDFIGQVGVVFTKERKHSAL